VGDAGSARLLSQERTAWNSSLGTVKVTARAVPSEEPHPSEFRSSVPMIKLRPVVDWLRARVDRDYPLAYARPFLVPEGKELLVAAQAETGLRKSCGRWCRPSRVSY